MAEAKAKKKFKMPSTYVILFGIIIFIMMLTWIIPGGAYQLDADGNAIAGTFHYVDAKPQGLWDALLAPIIGMLGSKKVQGAIPISLFILMFGSFLEMIDQTGAMARFLKSVANKYKKNMMLLIGMLVALMSFFGTVEGAYEEGIVYLMMFMPIILALGLDTMTTAMIVILGTQIGCLSSTINPFSVGIASGIAGISAGDGMGIRFAMFIVMTAVTIITIAVYARKVFKNPEASPQYYRREQDLAAFPVSTEEDTTLDKRQKRALLLFALTFLIMIVSLVPWTSLNPNWTFFDDAAAWIGATPILKQLLGSDIVPFGNWYFPELSMLLAVMTFVIGMAMGYNIDKTIGIFIKGASGLVSTAFIVPLARGIQVVMDAGQITPTILHFGEASLSSLDPVVFVVVALVFYFLIACLIPSSSGLAAATMGIMASLSRFAGVSPSIMVTIFIMALGMAKIVTPTSIILMTCTEAAGISYGTWLKKALPIVLIWFVLCVGFLFVSLALA